MVIQSYDDLSRKLWQLEGLPLSITSVQGAHPALRYTQVNPLIHVVVVVIVIVIYLYHNFKHNSIQTAANICLVIDCCDYCS